MKHFTVQNRDGWVMARFATEDEAKEFLASHERAAFIGTSEGALR